MVVCVGEILVWFDCQHQYRYRTGYWNTGTGNVIGTLRFCRLPSDPETWRNAERDYRHVDTGMRYRSVGLVGRPTGTVVPGNLPVAVGL